MRNVDDVVVGQYYRSIIQNSSQLNKTQQQIATGKRFQKASEAPSEAISLLRIEADRNVLNRQSERLATSKEIISHAANIYENVDGIAIEVDSLALEALSDSKSQDSRDSIASQISHLIDEMAQEASRNYRGKPLLGEFVNISNTDVPKYDREQAAEHTYVYVSDNNSMKIIPEDNLPELMNMGTELAEALKNGDTDLAREKLDAFRQEWDFVIERNGELGSRESFMENFIDRNESMDITFQKEKSNLEDIDLAKASIELKTFEQSYEMSLTVAQRVQELLDPNKFFSL